MSTKTRRRELKLLRNGRDKMTNDTGQLMTTRTTTFVRSTRKRDKLERTRGNGPIGKSDTTSISESRPRQSSIFKKKQGESNKRETRKRGRSRWNESAPENGSGSASGRQSARADNVATVVTLSTGEKAAQTPRGAEVRAGVVADGCAENAMCIRPVDGHRPERVAARYS